MTNKITQMTPNTAFKRIKEKLPEMKHMSINHIGGDPTKYERTHVFIHTEEDCYLIHGEDINVIIDEAKEQLGKKEK